MCVYTVIICIFEIIRMFQTDVYLIVNNIVCIKMYDMVTHLSCGIIKGYIILRMHCIISGPASIHLL